MNWREAFADLAAQLAAGGVENPVREAAIIWEWATQQSYSVWIAGGEVLSPEQRERAYRAAQRRVRHEPWAYIAGRQEFYGLPLVVTPAVLIPRAETEHLVERVLAARPASRQIMVDVGTGSGAVALAVARHRPEWSIWGVDISTAALQVAQENARRLRLPVKFQQSDLLQGVAGRVDVITANLPYVARGENVGPETCYEPEQALYAENNGLALIAALISQSPDWLIPGGQLFLECGAQQAVAVQQLLRQQGFSGCQVHQDLAGLDRIIAAVWGPDEGVIN